MEKQYLLTERQLLDLLENDALMRALEYGGVDNWSGYEESITDLKKDFCQEKKKKDCEIEDIAKDYLKNYFEIKNY